MRQQISKALSFIDDSPYALILVIIPCIIIRLLMVLGQQPVIWPDSIAYYSWAIRISQWVDVSNYPIYRTPGYPLFLAAFLAFGQSPRVIEVIMFGQYLLGLITVVMLYFVSKRIFDARVAFVSALFFGLHTLQLYYETVIQTEVLFIFFLVLMVLFFQNFLADLSFRNAVIMGVLLACISYVRPIGQALIVLLFLTVYLEVGSFSKIIRPFLVLIMAYVLMILPWCFVNKEIHGFFGLNRDLGLNTFHRVFDIDQRSLSEQTAYPKVKELIDHYRKKHQTLFSNIFFELQHEKHTSLSADKILLASALEAGKFDFLFMLNTAHNWSKLFLSANPSVESCQKGDYQRLCAQSRTLPILAVQQEGRSRVGWANISVNWFFDKAPLPMGLISVLAYFAVGLVMYYKKTPLTLLFLMVGIIMYFSLITAIFNNPHDRFRLPIDPFLIMLAAYFVLEICGLFYRSDFNIYGHYINRKNF